MNKTKQLNIVMRMIKNKWFQMIMASIMVFMLIWDIQRSFTGYPETQIINLDYIQYKMWKKSNIYEYLGSYGIFAYYTIISSILAIIVIIISWNYQVQIKQEIKTTIFINMLVSGIIFWISLAPFMPWGQNLYFDFINIYEHFIFVVFTSVWYFSTKPKKMSFQIGVLSTLTLPITYFMFAFIFYKWINGAASIYPFLNFNNVLFLNLTQTYNIIAVASIVVHILTLFMFLFLILNWINKRRIKKLA